jgi:hypothetical protein
MAEFQGMLLRLENHTSLGFSRPATKLDLHGKEEELVSKFPGD